MLLCEMTVERALPVGIGRSECTSETSPGTVEVLVVL